MNSVQRAIRVGTSFRDIISRLPQNSDNLPPTAIFATFRNLQNVEHMTQEDLQHYKFQSFLNRAESFIPQMTALELSDIAINILHTRPLRQNEIYGTIQDALMLKIEELPFERKLYLGVIIRKTQSALSFKSIHLKIREIFLENVEWILADHHKDIQILVSIAKYMDNNIEIIQMNILEAFSNALLRINAKPRNIHDSVSIIVVFSKFGALDAQSENALNKMIKLWIQFNPTLKEVETLLFLLSVNRTIQDKQVFEESGIIRFSLTFLSSKNSETVLSCYAHLMKMVIFFSNAIDVVAST